MGLKHYLIGGLAAVAIAAGVGWYRTEMARARAAGRVEVLSMQIEQRTTDYQTFRDSVAERDNTRAIEMARLRERGDSLDAELMVARRHAQTSVTELNELLAQSGIADSVLRAISATIDDLQREAEACSLAYRNCRQQLVVETERSFDYRSQVVRADSLILAQKAIIRQLGELQPKQSVLPWVVAGAAVVIAGAAIVF